MRIECIDGEAHHRDIVEQDVKMLLDKTGHAVDCLYALGSIDAHRSTAVREQS